MKTRGVKSQAAKAREKTKLDELTAQAEKALGLLDSETADGIIGEHTEEYDALIQGALDSETADGIIGEHTEEYDALIQGASAVMAMEWAMMKTHGLRQTPRSLRAGAQAMTMVLTLVHYAYALGVRKGRAEEPGEAEEPGSEGAGEPKTKPKTRAKAKPRSKGANQAS